jgi:hypothetical protein
MHEDPHSMLLSECPRRDRGRGLAGIAADFARIVGTGWLVGLFSIVQGLCWHAFLFSRSPSSRSHAATFQADDRAAFPSRQVPRTKVGDGHRL